jgi:hypothetical protein
MPPVLPPGYVVHIALAIELTISIGELDFTLLTPWLVWQPCFGSPSHGWHSAWCMAWRMVTCL